MKAPIRCAWDVNPEADRVWAQVTGMRLSESVRRVLVVVQAFMDESEDDEFFVIAGYVATAETWAAFSQDWEKTLPYGLRDKNGSWYFKMVDMAAVPERMARVPAFYRIIEKYPMLPISCTLRRVDLERAKKRIWVPHAAINWGYADNAYRFSFRNLLDTFHAKRAIFGNVLSENQPVDFIFDERSEKAPILSEWEGFKEMQIAKGFTQYGATPRFEDDYKFLPLQAADLWAWWVRQAWHSSTGENKIYEDDFPVKGAKSQYRVSISADEDTITNMLGEQACTHSASYLVYDLKNPYPNWRYKWRS
jgi:hypothetical protein